MICNFQVKLQDGRQTKGQVVGIDEARDIAAVRIQMVSQLSSCCFLILGCG